MKDHVLLMINPQGEGVRKMDDRGNIWTEEQLKELAKTDKKKLDELGKLIEIQEDELPELKGMNRHQRRKWYALNHKKRKKLEF